MWWLFQVLIMTLIIASSGAYLWAPQNDQPRLTITTADHKRRGSDEGRCFFRVLRVVINSLELRDGACG